MCHLKGAKPHPFSLEEVGVHCCLVVRLHICHRCFFVNYCFLVPEFWIHSCLYDSTDITSPPQVFCSAWCTIFFVRNWFTIYYVHTVAGLSADPLNICKTTEGRSQFISEDNISSGRCQLLKEDLINATVDVSDISESFDSCPYYLRYTYILLSH
jgi:hypothetical protein